MIEKRDFYIDGAWVAPLAPRDCPVIDLELPDDDDFGDDQDEDDLPGQHEPAGVRAATGSD